MNFSNEFILPHILTKDQNDILIGSLLGDGHLSLDVRSKYPRLKIERSIKDIKYLEYEFSYFKDLCSTDIHIYDRFDKRDGKSRGYCYFRTRAVPAFLNYYNKWYEDKKRIVPRDLELNPLILSIWFSDDGCVVAPNKTILILKLSTENFSKKDVEFLCFKLEERFGVKFPMYKKVNGFIIKTSTVPSQLFIKDVEYLIKVNGMSRKYDVWKNHELNIAHKIGKPKKVI